VSGYATCGIFNRPEAPIVISRDGDTVWFRSGDMSVSFSVQPGPAERARIRELLDEIDAEEAAKAREEIDQAGA
jgi:hypothetical protein